MIIYLHGFRSSPLSEKAQKLKRRMTELGMGNQLWCEQLPSRPSEAIELIERAILNTHSKPTLVGSSLGGYYATHLDEKHSLIAVLINPAAYAYRILAPHIGTHKNIYTRESFELTQEHIIELERIKVEPITQPGQFWLITEKGDEVLDYQEAVEKYSGAKQTVFEGGNHGLVNFPIVLDDIITFAHRP